MFSQIWKTAINVTTLQTIFDLTISRRLFNRLTTIPNKIQAKTFAAVQISAGTIPSVFVIVIVLSNEPTPAQLAAIDSP